MMSWIKIYMYPYLIAGSMIRVPDLNCSGLFFKKHRRPKYLYRKSWGCFMK